MRRGRLIRWFVLLFHLVFVLGGIYAGFSVWVELDSKVEACLIWAVVLMYVKNLMLRARIQDLEDLFVV